MTEKSGFAAAPGKGMGVSIADFNDDGWPDVFIANDTEPNSLFINQKNGTFAEKGLELGVAYNDNAQVGSSMGSDAKDFNNDGKVDIFYNNLMGQVWQLLRNRGGATFDYYSSLSKIQKLSMTYSGWSTGFIDYNNDGWKDIYSSNGDVDMVNAKSPQHDTMFENVDGKSFVDVSAEMGKDFLHTGYQRGLGVQRFEQRRVAGHRGDVAQRAAAHPDELRRHRQSLAGAETDRAQKRARRYRSQGQSYHRIRPYVVQPRVRQRRIHVLQRQARALRVRRGDEDRLR